MHLKYFVQSEDKPLKSSAAVQAKIVVLKYISGQVIYIIKLDKLMKKMCILLPPAIGILRTLEKPK